MNQVVLPRRQVNKLQFYQLILLDNQCSNNIFDVLSKSEIQFTELVSLNSKLLFLVEAPQNIGRLLKNLKNYEIYSFTNDDFISFFSYMLKTSSLDSIEFLGESYFEPDLQSKLDNLSLKSVPCITQLIKDNNLKINKFKVKLDAFTFTFYRSGMIYTNNSIQDLSKMVVNFLRGING
jgi:hypothetical protein